MVRECAGLLQRVLGEALYVPLPSVCSSRGSGSSPGRYLLARKTGLLQDCFTTASYSETSPSPRLPMMLSTVHRLEHLPARSWRLEDSNDAWLQGIESLRLSARLWSKFPSPHRQHIAKGACELGQSVPWTIDVEPAVLSLWNHSGSP